MIGPLFGKGIKASSNAAADGSTGTVSPAKGVRSPDHSGFDNLTTMS